MNSINIVYIEHSLGQVHVWEIMPGVSFPVLSRDLSKIHALSWTESLRELKCYEW